LTKLFILDLSCVDF